MKVRFLFSLLFLSVIATAQEVSIPTQFISKVKEAPERYLGKDTFEWQYTITSNTLRKEKDGRFVEYKNVSLGDIFKVDIQNPLQVVVFYRRFNTVVLLDNQLNETARIDFSQLPPSVPQMIIADAAGLASQNRLWIFDLNQMRLGLYDIARAAFKTITPPFTDTIRYYQSGYNYFYWIDTKGQCFVVNPFGNVNLLGSVPDFEQAQIISQNAILLKKDNS